MAMGTGVSDLTRDPPARVEGIAWVFSVLTLLSHGLAVVHVLADREPYAFRLELVVALIAAAGCSFLTAYLPKLFHFLIAEGIHTIALIVTVSILSGRSLVVEFLVIIPYLFEFQLFVADQRFVSVAQTAAIILFVVTDGRSGRFPGLPERLAHLSILLFGSAAAMGFMRLLLSYRERLAEVQAVNANYEEALANIVQANIDLQSFAAIAEQESAERERHRIIREIHDGVGYSLTSIMMTINAALLLAQSESVTEDEIRADSEKMMAILEEARQNAAGCLQDTRRTLYNLRSIPDESNRYGPIGLVRLVKAFGLATGIEIDVHLGNLPGSLGDAMDEAVYRFVQEGLTNSFRHGKAGRVSIQSRIQDSVLEVVIIDNGHGTPVKKEGIGLSGMKERFAAINGSIEATNIVGGFKLRAEVPVVPEVPIDG